MCGWTLTHERSIRRVDRDTVRRAIGVRVVGFRDHARQAQRLGTGERKGCTQIAGRVLDHESGERGRQARDRIVETLSRTERVDHDAGAAGASGRCGTARAMISIAAAISAPATRKAPPSNPRVLP